MGSSEIKAPHMEFMDASNDVVRLKGTAEDKTDLLTILQFAKNYDDMGTYAGVDSDKIDAIKVDASGGVLTLSKVDFIRIFSVLNALEALGARDFEIPGMKKSFSELDDEIDSFREEIIPSNHADCDF